jgi:flagellar biosynthetic protein FliO
MRNMLMSILIVTAILTGAGLGSGQTPPATSPETKPAVELATAAPAANPGATLAVPVAPPPAAAAAAPAAPSAWKPPVKRTWSRWSKPVARPVAAAPPAVVPVAPPAAPVQNPAIVITPATPEPVETAAAPVGQISQVPAPAIPQAVPQPVSAAPAVQAGNASGSPAAAVQDIPTIASEFPYTRVLGAFGIVMTLIGGAVFGTRKFAPQLFRKAPSEKNLRIIETLAIGEKRSISVVQIEDKRFLIGSTTSQITLLAALRGPLSIEDELSVESVPAEVPAAVARPKAPVERFRNIFEIEKASPARNGGRGRTIPPDVRAKMRQLRETLEQ